MMANEWTTEGLISPNVKIGWCGFGTPVLGGSGVVSSQGSFSRTYQNLSGHNIIYYEIGVKMIGGWKDNQDTLTLKVDGSTLKSFTIEKVGDSDKRSSCSGRENDLDTRLVGSFDHSSSSVTISLAWDLSSSPEVSFAIKDVSLTPRFVSYSPRTSSALVLTDTLAKGTSSGSEDNGKTGCPTGYYSEGNYCFRCNAACQDCFGPSSSECYQCKWNYNFDGDQCIQCAANCVFCSGDGSNQCLLCNPGYTLDFDGTCNAEDSCNTWPSVIKSNKILGDRADFVRICEYGCPPGSFMLWNYTCSPTCDAPLVQRREGENWCDYPCSPDDYLWSDGSCLDYCPDFFSIRMEAVYKFCEDVNFTSPSHQSCDESYLFKYQNGSCLWECSDPYIEEFHDQGSFCNLPCPQGYLNNLTKDCVRTCEPLYVRVENNVPYCDGEDSITNFTNGCDSIFDFKYPNGSCLPTCPLPYRDEWHVNSYFCYPPCPDRYYDSVKDICLDSCDLDGIRVPGDIVECEVRIGCPSALDFKYPNGSCLSSCEDPYRGESYYGSHFCNSPCLNRYLDSPSGACVDTCENEFVRYEDNFIYCDGHSDPNNNGTNNTNSTAGCPSVYDFKYPNGSCLSTCNSPYRSDWYNGSYFCSAPCPGRYFDILRETCVDACEPEFIRFEDDILYCDGESDHNNNGTNSTNSTTGCPSIWDFKYPNGSCLSSCPPPRRDEWNNGSYFCYPPCPGRYFDLLRESCVDACEPEYIIFDDDDILYCDGESGSNNGTNSTNSTTGCPSIYDFKYPNGSCLPSCPYPYSDEWHNGSYFCYPPCPNRYFDAVKETCVDSCEPEYVRFEEDILYCESHSDSNNGTNSTNSTTGCPSIYDFKYPNGSCLSSCPYPRRDEWSNGSYFCYAPCSHGYWSVLTKACVGSCPPEYVRFEDDILYCESHTDPNNSTNSTNTTTGCPNIYDFKYLNGSCLPTCPFPYREEWHNGSYFCNPPCPNQYFDLLKESCASTCEPEYVQFDQDILYCAGQSNSTNPNNSTNSTNSTTGCPNIFDFKYPNGSCLSSCPPPRRDEWHDESYFCYPPCSFGYFDTLGQVCVGTCEAEYIRFDGDILYCDGSNNGTNSTNSTSGCPDIYDFKYPNGSCLSSCPSPHRNEWQNGSYFCYPPCPGRYYDILRESCLNSCEPEYIRFDDDILYCDGHSNPNNGTNSTNSTTGCPNIYDFKYANGSCLPTCPFPYRDEWQNGSYFCYPPCSNQYFDILKESCVSICEPEFIEFEEDLLYCTGHSNATNPNNGTNSTNSTTGCPNIYDFKYPNGSCLSSCPYPHRDEWHDGSYFCYPPCTNKYFDAFQEICIDSCEPEYIRMEDGILYCEGHSNHTNGTNSTNSTTGCPNIYAFKYSNGSCLSSCPSPYREEWRDGSYFCDAPCPNGYFDISTKACVSTCEPEFVRFEDDILYCDGHSHPNNSTNSTNSTVGCPSIYEFKYPNGSCLSSCPSPYRDEWHNGSYFCSPPCPSKYLNTLDNNCIDSCEPEYIRFEDDILYCDGHSDPNNSTNSANSTVGCPSPNDYKYLNGSCLSGCPYPYQDEFNQGSYLCNPPCQNKYFDILNNVCLDTCASQDIRIEGDISYCDLESGSNNGTNSTNSTTGCPNIYDFKYENGSCLSTCPYPYKEELQGGSYFCNAPCPNGYFDISTEACVSSCEPEYIQFEDDIAICEASSSNNSSECTIDYATDGSATTNCTDPSGLCPTGSFLFEDDSCNETCSSDFTPYLNVSCIFPCGLDGALYPDGSCASGCSTGYTLQKEGSFQFCVEDTTTSNNQTNSTNSTNSTSGSSYSVSVSIYVRYDIPLSDFNAQNYLAKFISLLANLLGVDSSEIIIISIRSGSTIIESKVVLTSASDSQSIAATKAKANTMDETLTLAADQNNLNLDGIAVLNSNFGVVTPEEDQSNDESTTKKSKTSKLTILIAMIAIAVVISAIAAFSFYKFKMRRKSRKVTNLGRVKGYKLGANLPVTDQTRVQIKKRDEEEAALFEDQSPVNAKKGKIRLSEALKPPVKTDLEKRPDSAQVRAQVQARAQKMAEMRGRFRPRISHQLEAIGEDENGNAIGFTGLMKSDA